MFHGILPHNTDENYDIQTNRLTHQRNELLKQRDRVGKLLKKLSVFSPIPLKTTCDDLKDRAESFPAQSVLKQFQVYREMQLQNRSQRYKAAALLIKEWRRKIANRIQKRMQIHLVYMYLIRRSGPEVLNRLDGLVRRSEIKKRHQSSAKSNLLRRHFYMLVHQLRLWIMHRKAAVYFSPRKCGWTMFRRKLTSFILTSRSHYVLVQHSNFHYSKSLTLKFWKLLLDYSEAKRCHHLKLRKYDHFYRSKMLRKGLISLALNKIKHVKKTGLNFLNGKKRQRQGERLEDSSTKIGIIDVAMKKYAHHSGDRVISKETAEERYTDLLMMQRSLRRLKKRTVDVSSRLRLASSVCLITRYRQVLNTIVNFRSKRQLHQKIVLAKMISQQRPKVLFVKRSKWVLLSCVVRRCIGMMRNQGVSRKHQMDLSAVGVHYQFLRCKRRAVQFWYSWCQKRGSRVLKATGGPVPSLAMKGTHSDQRSVTIINTPRSVLTELTDDLDNSTIFGGGGSTARNSLRIADFHFRKQYGSKYIQLWLERVLQRGLDRKQMLSREQLLKDYVHSQMIQAVLCWRIYFLFSHGRKIKSSVLANVILAAASSDSNHVKAKTGFFATEAIQRFRYLGETHKWLQDTFQLARDYWVRTKVRKALVVLRQLLKRERKLVRMSTAEVLIKKAFALRKWRNQFVPRSQWMNARIKVADFVVVSKYFRLFKDRVFTAAFQQRNNKITRKNTKLKTRNALSGNIYWRRFASEALYALAKAIATAKRKHVQLQSMDEERVIIQFHRAIRQFEIFAAQSLLLLHKASHQHQIILLQRGLNGLKCTIQSKAELSYQITRSAQAQFYHRGNRLLFGFRALLDNAVVRRSTNNTQMLKSRRYLELKYFLQWRYIHGQKKDVGYWMYASDKHRRLRAIRSVINRFRSLLLNRLSGEYRVQILSGSEWTEYTSDEGYSYFFNGETGESVWKMAGKAIVTKTLHGLPLYQYLSMRRGLRFIKDHARACKAVQFALRSIARKSFSRWKTFCCRSRPWRILCESYEKRILFNARKSMALYFRRWFLNNFPRVSIREFDRHYSGVKQKHYFRRWYGLYQNTDLLEIVDGDFKHNEQAERAIKYHLNRKKIVGMTRLLTCMSTILAGRTLEKRITEGRKVKLLSVALANMMARADDGYEVSVVSNRVDAYLAEKRQGTAMNALFSNICSRLVQRQRLRISELNRIRLMKKRGMYHLLKHVVLRQTIKRRKEKRNNTFSFERNESFKKC